VKMRYRVHRFDIKMTRDLSRLEQFLNSLEGEVVTIIPNVSTAGGPPHAWTFFSSSRRWLSPNKSYSNPFSPSESFQDFMPT